MFPDRSETPQNPPTEGHSGTAMGPVFIGVTGTSEPDAEGLVDLSVVERHFTDPGRSIVWVSPYSGGAGDNRFAVIVEVSGSDGSPAGVAAARLAQKMRSAMLWTTDLHETVEGVGDDPVFAKLIAELGQGEQDEADRG